MAAEKVLKRACASWPVIVLVVLMVAVIANISFEATPAFAASGSPITINKVTVYPQNDPHPWGNCQVQDYKDRNGQNWLILSLGYWKSSQHTSQNFVSQRAIVRGGMLFGWFDQRNSAGKGGAEGPFECPLNDEHGYMNGVRQDFQHGSSLYWVSGMNHAARIDFGREGALQWAWSFFGTPRYAGLCLEFVVTAYNTGQFHGSKRLVGGPYDNPATGFQARAYMWWYSRPKADQNPHDTNAPRGALVIWDKKADPKTNSGHIALSLGGGWAVSTEFGGVNTVHVIKISSFPNYYLGWITPK